MTWGSLWNYYRDEIDDVDDNASDDKSFKYETKMIEKTHKIRPWPPQPPQNPDGTQPPQSPQLAIPILNVEVNIPFKYIRNFYRFLDLWLINCKIEFDLSWHWQNIIIT